MIKLLALDIDGTILTDEKIMTDKTRRAIEDAVNAGVIVVPATGRPYHGIPKELTDIPGLKFVVCSNGAVLYERQGASKDAGPQGASKDAGPQGASKDAGPQGASKDARVLRSRCIPANEGIAIYEMSGEFECQGEMLADGYGFATPPYFRFLTDLYEFTPLMPYIRQSRLIVDDPAERVRDMRIDVENIFVTAPGIERKKMFIEALREKFKGISIIDSSDITMEVVSERADKGDMITHLAEKLKIARDEIMVIGDGINDLGLIRKAGHSAAMGNACVEIKNVSEFITEDNANDGAAKAIYRYVLGEPA